MHFFLNRHSACDGSDEEERYEQESRRLSRSRRHRGRTLARRVRRAIREFGAVFVDLLAERAANARGDVPGRRRVRCIQHTVGKLARACKLAPPSQTLRAVKHACMRTSVDL